MLVLIMLNEYIKINHVKSILLRCFVIASCQCYYFLCAEKPDPFCSETDLHILNFAN